MQLPLAGAIERRKHRVGAPMSKIVISYRRSDSKAMAGRIRDCLVEHYGDDSVFMDIENIPPGVDFRTHIDNEIHGSDLFLAIVGPKWRGQNRSGGSRIKDEADPVRAELEAAIERNIPVIPVLVDDAIMPKASDLPDKIKDFSYRNAVTVDAGEDFHVHMERLIGKIDKMLGAGRLMTFEPRRWVRFLRHGLRPALAVPTMAGLCAIAFGAWWLAPSEVSAYVPPSPRSHWSVGDSVVFLEPDGPVRQFYFIDPGAKWRGLGAEPGTLLFDGRREGSTYHGKAYVFAGRCGKFAFDVQGPVLNDDRTVDLSGTAPQIDTATCSPRGFHEERLVFNLKYLR